MKKTVLTREVIEAVRDFSLPTYDRLPDMGLYLEQTTKYINQTLQPLGCFELTGSMIRNYVKQGLIDNPVRKQYYSRHIAYLLALTVFKPVLPLEHIHQMFRLQKASYPLQTAYDYFGRTFTDSLQFRFGITDSLNDTGSTESLEKELLSCAVTAVSHMIYLNTCYKLIAEGERKSGSDKG
ncbi:MAG: DUF1836 domain-containing protein [Lachnospiraceae bacterium]